VHAANCTDNDRLIPNKTVRAKWQSHTSSWIEPLCIHTVANTDNLRIPNQPLYDGRKEDALIAYTFDQYLSTGDTTWPLLFPMVKSAVRGMDTVQALARQDFGQKINRFLVTGASKRGWTTWLSAAVDPRVKAIAPIVIDMLNMKVQTQWAAKMYGRQSEEIEDYTSYNHRAYGRAADGRAPAMG